MMASYKPDRPVTSEKIKLTIERLFQDKFKRQYATAAGTWKRVFRQSLPKTRCQMRGFTGFGLGAGVGPFVFAAIAVSTDDDSKLMKVYLLEGNWKTLAEAQEVVQKEAQSLAVLEVMFHDD